MDAQMVLLKPLDRSFLTAFLVMGCTSHWLVSCLIRGLEVQLDKLVFHRTIVSQILRRVCMLVWLCPSRASITESGVVFRRVTMTNKNLS